MTANVWDLTLQARLLEFRLPSSYRPKEVINEVSTLDTYLNSKAAKAVVRIVAMYSSTVGTEMLVETHLSCVCLLVNLVISVL